MKIILESKDNIKMIRLPNEVSGNYWVLDNSSKNLLNIEAKEGKWIVRSNQEVKLYKDVITNELGNSSYISETIVEEYMHFNIFDYTSNKVYIMYVLPSFEKMENLVFDFLKYEKIEIGKNNCEININNDLFSEKQLLIQLDKQTNKIIVKNLNTSISLFVNNNFCTDSVLANGDVIFIAGVYIYFFGKIILINNNKNQVLSNSSNIQRRVINENPTIDYTDKIDREVCFFNKDSYFERPPRFKRKIENKVFNIDSPPQKQTQEEMPLVFTVAPMLTMGMMSLVTGITALQRVLDGKSTLEDEFSSLLMCGCMMLSMILFPLAQRFYTKIKKKKREEKRRVKYKKYIDNKREEIFAEINYQKQVLIEDNLPIEKVKNIILNKSRNLWERKFEHDDFLELRLGIGNKKPDIDIKYPEEHFTLDEDDLKDIITELVNESKDIENVPITLNFRENNKVGIIGDKTLINNFYDNLMLQIMAYHGYDLLRLIIITNDSNKNYWEKFRNLPYLWNNDKSIRYFATNKDDVNKITSFLMEEYNYRKEISGGKPIQFSPYYLILTDDIAFLKNNVFIKEVLLSNINLGYSIIMSVDKVDLLPNECKMFINITKDMSGLFTNQMTLENQLLFTPDIVNFSLKNCITNISNTPLDIYNGSYVLPKKYGFLEMFDVGNVNQLNLLNRWESNNIIKSLETPVGVDEQGELFKIDLHEKAHGPHGLVAGMTGSGKSEWIITYILSMAINYSPEEVQFVLIDYKGGGLALTFDNQELGIKLPHVVGTITNLDVVEIKRSLASIESELKRRQTMFKKARELLNESSMDIYKYQEYYRSGQLEEPMSHLFIISDEFAELKAQQPEFMDELISTARIGRSLGVHLILATQKPSGVVNDQIWSNSKFKVCLKVQDKSDSNDMLKCPDAAMLKDTGRFYFQVGYNEFFALGQSAYAGMPYYESDKKVNVVDANIDFVDNMGATIKNSNITKNNTHYKFKGEELPNVLNYIIKIAEGEKLKIKPLWLSRIPNTIYVDNLKQKYKWEREPFILNPIIGEYDHPSKQKQGLLTLPLSEEGNAIIYGSTGSGKENLLSTIIYSLSTSYSYKEVNIYVLDFGSQVLSNFEAMPHVGDIIHSNDDEKIENLFKFVNTEIDIRRKKMLSYNGNYRDFIKSSDEKMPNLLIIINSYEVFIDLYGNYADIINEITRECTRYGIYFILTSSNTNSIRSRTSQNFKTILSLQLINESEYTSLFGNTNGIKPSKSFGRGLIKMDKVLEFQSAFASDREKLYEDMKTLSIKSFMELKAKAMRVPVLPEKVVYNDIVRNEFDLSNIPFGLLKETLSCARINMKENLGYLLACRNLNDITPFIENFMYIISQLQADTFVFDSRYTFDNFDYKGIVYLDNNYSSYLKKIDDYCKQVLEIFNNNQKNLKSIKDVKDVLIVIIGVEKFVKNLSSEDKALYDSIISVNKEINKVHIIFIDSYNSLKKCEFESWYKDSVDSSNGLYIGDGFAEQYSIKPTKILQEYYKNIGNNYGYLVKNGNVKFVKIIESIK